MLPNLDAEQARAGKTNREMAKILKMSEHTYGIKKRRGTFKQEEIVTLLALFDSTFEHLFAAEKDTA